MAVCGVGCTLRAVVVVAVGEGRPLLRATVGPRASAVIAHHLGRLIEARAAGYERTGPGGVQVAEELRAALAEMRESGRLRNRPQAVYGTTEVPETADDARSGLLLGADELMSVDQVVTRTGYSRRWITQLCEDKVLVAHHLATRGRPWGIDPVSVEVFEENERRRG